MLSSQLNSTINDELRWREAELAIAKIHLHRAMLDKGTFEYSYRCFAMLTYAHYEAYSKRVVAQALQDIYTSGVKWSDCQPMILTNVFAQKLRKEIASASNEDLVNLSIGSKCIMDGLKPPNTAMILDCGNLNNANFDWIVSCIGLDPARFAGSRRDIGRITSLRHECAHGEELSLDTLKTKQDLAAEIFALQSRILLLMHNLSVEIIDHFEKDGYKVKI